MSNATWFGGGLGFFWSRLPGSFFVSSGFRLGGEGFFEVCADPFFQCAGTHSVAAGEGDTVASLMARDLTPAFREGRARGVSGDEADCGAEIGDGFFLIGFGKSEHEFIELEAILAHREVDFVKTSGGDIDPNFSEDADVDFFGTLFVIPMPFILGDPLHAGTGLGPGAIDAEVKAIVLGSGGVGADPAVVASRGVEFYVVGEHGHLAGGVDEIFFLDELISVGAPGVRQNLEVGSSGGGGGMGGITIGLDVGSGGI